MAEQQVPQVTPELLRVVALPRRAWSEADVAACVEAMTRLLRRPGGTMTLRPIQAIALLEIGLSSGGFLPIRVAGGKTIISLLAFTVLASSRPLLLVPAKLQEKTRRAWKHLAQHWKIHPSIRILSYELAGRVQSREILEQWKPDAIVCDEGHKLKDTRTGVTKRVRWYLDANPETKFVDMSGTITKRSIGDYAHRARWALRDTCPLPNDWRDLKTWSGVIDEPSGAWKQEREAPDPGALAMLGAGDVREAFRSRCHDTLGWVATRESELSIPVLGDVARIPVPPAVASALTHLRDTWSSPDGEEEYDYAPEVWAHARQIGLGFWYAWDPPAPLVWKAKRKAWGQWVRHILENNRRRLATPLDVANACDQGHYPDALAALEEWRAVRDSFVPVTVPRWIDSFALEWAARELASGDVLLWTEHRAFADRLSAETGVPYYAGGGLDARKRSILDHRKGPAIVSVKAIGEGFDLQHFARNVVASAPTSGKDWEQLLGRTLREGQLADEVSVLILSTCDEHDAAIGQAKADAEYIETTTGQRQALLTVDWV